MNINYFFDIFNFCANENLTIWNDDRDITKLYLPPKSLQHCNKKIIM